jgi:hypothetical protein
MPQCTSATFSRVERAGPSERHARLDRPPPSIDRWTGRISTNATSRRRHDGVRRAPEPSDQDAAAPDSGGAGPELCPEWQRERCAGIFRMTTGSCSVAITRRRPPHWERTRVWCSPSCRCGAAPRERTETVTRREPNSPATFDPCSPRRTPEKGKSQAGRRERLFGSSPRPARGDSTLRPRPRARTRQSPTTCVAPTGFEPVFQPRPRFRQ